MFFHNLPNFSPYSGHIYDSLKVPFITKGGRVFERSNGRFDLMDREGYFPFREYRTANRVYFISDADLFELFTSSREELEKKYEANYLQGWPDAVTLYKDRFFEGYDQGREDYSVNLGPSYTNLTYKEKLPFLRIFCLRCLDFLFFDGDLDEKLFYNLGYLQANLCLAFIEINNLLGLYPGTARGIRIHFESFNKEDQLVGEVEDSEVEDIKSPESSVSEKRQASPSVTLPPRIEIMCDPQEIRTVWQILTAPIRTKNGWKTPVLEKSHMEQFLGASFQSGGFPYAFDNQGPAPMEQIKSSRGDMRNVLLALMYTTFNLNRDHNRGNILIDYVAILKAMFSVFSNSTEESLKSSISAHSAKGLEVLKRSTDTNPHIEKTLNILKKHKILH